MAHLSVFTDSVPDNHALEVLLAHAPRVTVPLMPEQGPDPVSGVVPIDNATFTTLLSLSSGASATSRFTCRTLLDKGSPHSFIQGAFNKMIETGIADASYIQAITPKSWSGFGIPDDA